MDSSATELPEFGVPEEEQLPEELQGPTPRPLPDSVKHGRLARMRSLILWGCLTAAVVCIAASFFSFMKTLALYILPLGYLLWIGIGLVAIGVIVYVRASRFKRACRYIQEGEAAFARVATLVKTPTMTVNGQTTTHAFVTQVEVVHPDSGEVVVKETKSPDFSTDAKDRIDTRFRVGDWVPVVWLPNEFDDTFQIYDFLEVTPDASLLRSNETQTPFWLLLLLAAAVPGLFFVLFWNVYAQGRYYPLDFDDFRQGWVPLVVGGLCGLTAVVVVYIVSGQKRKKLAVRNVQAIESGEAIELPVQQKRLVRLFWALVIAAGAVLLCGLTALCGCFTANALLDNSPARPVPVEVTEMIQTTHAFIFREYQLKYRRAGDDDDHSLLTTPEHLMQFQTPFGAALVHDGWLGWPWVETVEPAVIVPEEADGP